MAPTNQKQPVFSELVQSKIRDPAFPLRVEERIEFVAECIKQGDANAKAALKNPTSIVMVLGNTGAGKSTLINYIFGCKMIEEKQGLGKVISVDEGKGNNPSVVSIGNTNESATFLPFVSKVPNSNLALVDNAGFCDNRGSEFNIVNAVNMVSAMYHSQSIVILLCIEYNAFLAQRAQGFKSLSSTLKSIFDDKVLHEHSASFLVCVTKTPSDCDFEVLERTLRDFLSEEKLPKSIADGLFIYDPIEQRRSDAAKTRNEILDILKQAPKIKPTECEYNPPLTDTDKIALAEITKQMGNKVISHLKDDKLDDALVCLKILDQLKQIGGSTIQKLLEDVHMEVGDHYNSKAETVKGMCTNALLSAENGPKDALQQVEEIKKRAQTMILGPLKSLKTILPDVDVHQVDEAKLMIETTSNAIKQKLKKMSKAASPQLLDCKRKSDTSCDIKWNIPTSYTPIKGYELSLNNSIQNKVSDPRHTIKDLLPGQDYKIKVRAVNDAGEGGWSNVLTIKTTSTKPPMPSNLKVTNVNDDSFTFSWQKPEVTRPGETEIQSYVVTKNGVPIFDGMYSELRLSITNLKANTKYKIGIRATNLAGSGPEATVSKTTSNRIQADIDKKQKELKLLDTKNEIIVHTKGYDENDSDIVSCTHIRDTFNCDYKISKVSRPDRCWTFAPTINRGTGCSWRGNSQTNGRVIGEVKVYARNCDKHWKEIKGLKKEIEGLEAKARAIAENAYE